MTLRIRPTDHHPDHLKVPVHKLAERGMQHPVEGVVSIEAGGGTGAKVWWSGVMEGSTGGSEGVASEPPCYFQKKQKNY
jgi:hypothetical protein